MLNLKSHEKGIKSSVNQAGELNKKPNAAQLTRNFETTMKVQWAQELSQNWIHLSPAEHAVKDSSKMAEMLF